MSKLIASFDASDVYRKLACMDLRLSSDDLCRVLGISQATLYRIRHRDPNFPKPDKTFLKHQYSISAVKNYINSQEKI